MRSVVGGLPNSDERKGGCVNLVVTRVREGVQNPENLADVICTCPLMEFTELVSLENNLNLRLK